MAPPRLATFVDHVLAMHTHRHSGLSEMASLVFLDGSRTAIRAVPFVVAVAQPLAKRDGAPPHVTSVIK